MRVWWGGGRKEPELLSMKRERKLIRKEWNMSYELSER